MPLPTKVNLVVVARNAEQLSRLAVFIYDMLHASNDSSLYKYEVYLYTPPISFEPGDFGLADSVIKEISIKGEDELATFADTDKIFLEFIVKHIALYGKDVMKQGLISLVRINENNIEPPKEYIFKNIVRSAELMFFDLFGTKKDYMYVRELQPALQRSLNLFTQPNKQITIIKAASPVYCFHPQVLLHRSANFFEDILRTWAADDINRHWFSIFLLDNIKKVYFGVTK